MRFTLLFFFLTLSCLVFQARGQEQPAVKKDLNDAVQKLQQLSGISGQIPAEISDAAKSVSKSTELKDEALNAAKAILPEAKKLLMPEIADKKSNSSTIPSQSLKSTEVEGPVPQSLPAIAATSQDRVPSVVIEADNSVFDLNSAIFVYTGRVRARHPQFFIECDELILEMVKPPDESKSAKDKTQTASIKGNSDGLVERKDSGIKKATATGATVTIEKISEEGDTQIGKCRKAVYDGITGEIVMSNYPQVQKGNILHVATQPDTLMIFDQKGSLRTIGRPRTIILSDGDKASGDLR